MLQLTSLFAGLALCEDFDARGFTLWALLYEPKLQIRNDCTKLPVHLKESEKT